MTTSNICHFEK